MPSNPPWGVLSHFGTASEVSTTPGAQPKGCPLLSLLPGSFHFASPACLHPGLSADNLPLLVNLLFILLKCVKKKKSVQENLGRSHYSVLYGRSGELRQGREQFMRGDHLPQAVSFSPPHNPQGTQYCTQFAVVETEAQGF